jgi:hypothetical protein
VSSNVRFDMINFLFQLPVVLEYFQTTKQNFHIKTSHLINIQDFDRHYLLDSMRKDKYTSMYNVPEKSKYSIMSFAKTRIYFC